MNSLNNDGFLSSIISNFVRLKKISNNYIGTCPFHADAWLTLFVDDKKGIYFCRQCKAKGDADAFLKNYKNTDIFKAHQELLKLSREPKEGKVYTEHKIVKSNEVIRNHQPNHQYFQDIIRRLEDKLNEFKIEAKVINILKGPVVDTFELELSAGVKVSRITSIEDDISLAFSGVPVRAVFPMKGRTTVGIEIPRNPRETIYLDDVLSSANFIDTKHRLPIAMGKSSLGEVTIVDLASMPHLLIAGSTGAGKSVFINSLLISLLVKMSPENLKLILIDPKNLELGMYSKLPHLMLPILTEPKTVSMAIQWAIEEMERRYSILREFGVRSIDLFNEKLKTIGEEYYERISKFYTEQDEEYELPYIVIIVDEFADLVLSSFGNEIENNIARLTAKARAAGIHLVLTTQRPTVDVITGIIKNSFPSRVAFKVTSDLDSRTILNTYGAEKLLGKGDMLFLYGNVIQRHHAAYVDRNEIEGLIEKLANIPSKMNQSAMDYIL